MISIANAGNNVRKHKRSFFSNAFYNNNNIEYRPFYSPDLWGASSLNHDSSAPLFVHMSSNQINSELQSDEKPTPSQYEEDTSDNTMTVEQPFRANPEYNRQTDNQLYSITTQHNLQPYEDHTEMNNVQLYQPQSPTAEQMRPVNNYHSVKHTQQTENQKPSLHTHTTPVTFSKVPVTYEYENSFPSLVQVENQPTERPYQNDVSGYPANLESPANFNIPVDQIQFVTESELEQFNQYGHLVGADIHVADYPVQEVCVFPATEIYHLKQK